TRPKKERLTDQDRRLLMAHWNERSRVAGIRFGNGERARKGTPRQKENAAEESIEFAIAHLTERQSVMLDTMLMTTAMQHVVCRATHDELRAELSRRIAANDVIAEEPLYRFVSDGDGSPAKSRGEWEADARRY